MDKLHRSNASFAYELKQMFSNKSSRHFVGNKAKGRVCIRGKKCSFLGKFGVFCFRETPVLRFTLLPYYQHLPRPL